MGHVIDVDDRVSVELRRESFRLVVGTDTESLAVEFDYFDAAEIARALEHVTHAKRYLDFIHEAPKETP